MPRCIHLIPVDGLGGVEMAARSLLRAQHVGTPVDVHIMYIADSDDVRTRRLPGQERVIPSGFASINDPRAYLSAFRTLLREKPEILVCSLWRTMLLGILYKLVYSRVKLVCFLHNEVTFHFPDRVLNGAGMLFADAIWSDSDRTFRCRVPDWLKRRKQARTISYLLEKHDPERLPGNSPSFVYWGRLHHSKGLDRALRLIAALAKKQPKSEYFVFGPDDGEREHLQGLAVELGIAARVHFMGVTSFQEMKKIASQFSYYLQLSKCEGMAISVVEAMQLGLVPVVAPVGEIASYCNRRNAVIVADADRPEAYVEVLDQLLSDDLLHDELQRHALQSWQGAVPYGEDFVTALHELG